jgi:hypothetical protein
MWQLLNLKRMKFKVIKNKKQYNEYLAIADALLSKKVKKKK